MQPQHSGLMSPKGFCLTGSEIFLNWYDSVKKESSAKFIKKCPEMLMLYVNFGQVLLGRVFGS